MALISGTGGPDTLAGTSEDDTINGGAGNDNISGGGGNDTINGEGDDDFIAVRQGAHIINGGDGTDTLRLITPANPGEFDVYMVDLRNNHFYVDAFGAPVSSVSGIENVTGTALPDFIWGTGANNILAGEGGTDFLSGGAGDDLLLGSGNLRISNGQLVITEIGAGIAGDELVGGDGNDRLVGGHISDSLSGGNDNDIIEGNGGDDQIFGGGSNDSLYGADGNDLISPGSGDDLIDGGGGRDTAFFYHADPAFGGVTISLQGQGSPASVGAFGIETLIGIENLTGSAFSDNLSGDDGGNVLAGGVPSSVNGSPTVNDDTINGLGGDDLIVAGTGNHNLDGGTGIDSLAYEGAIPENHDSQASLFISLGLQGQSQFTAYGDWTLNNFENLSGWWGNDHLTGNGEGNILAGSAGSDVLTGGAGSDVLLGDGEIRAWSGPEAATTYENLVFVPFGAFLLVIGNDTLDGGEGDDRMVGGRHDDVYFVDSLGDVVVEQASEGNDEVRTGLAAHTLAANVEKLIGTGFGQALTGNDLANTIVGTSGHDVIDGAAGADSMTGGQGNDSYYVDDAGDTVVEAQSADTDEIRTSLATLSLAGFANIEKLTGVGYVDQTLTGTDGNDVIDGGQGADAMGGGLGDDIYIVDNEGDTTGEAAGAGIDTVRSSVSYALGDNVERLTLTGTEGLSGFGNNQDNVIQGNDGHNFLRGGAGADILIGLGGHDAYDVIDAADIVIEVDGGGIDQVQSWVSHTLAEWVENLILIDGIAGTGNGIANNITGNGHHNMLDGKGGADTMAGGDGNDTYFVDHAGDLVTGEAASSGTDTVRSSVTFTLPDHFEHLILLSSALNGTGNGLANSITGNGANNVLNGMAGADIMAGGAGHDTYVVDHSGDLVTEAASGGNDTVQSSVTYTLGSNLESLTLTGTGAISGTGNALNNIINGNNAANFLNGGIGADFMTGGGGDDTYFVDNASDKVTEAAGGGTDTVNSSVNWTLSAATERLVLTGTGSLTGIGNGLANIITGNSAANILNGGIGADTMQGGLGNDTFIVDDVGDVATDTGGVDTVQSGVTITLHASIDNLILTGAAAVNGTGNGLWNVMTGNGAANTLDGGVGNDILNGGLGADMLIGGAGHDTYHVDNVGDQVIDTGGGNDHVHASIDYVLGTDLEYLTLTGTAVSATGNAKNNLLYGNAGNNVIDGLLGADFMVGGLGNDIYYVENGSDQITEHLNQGTDTVMSSVHHALRGNIENLTLIGTNAVSATGNELANVITGNSAANAIRGGLGADTLSGGGGNDTFVYRATNESTSASKDQITGFNAGDKINLSVIDAISSTTANNDAFTFVGSNAFSNTAGELRAAESGGVWTIEADVNGDGLADLVIGVTTEGGYMIGAADFIL
jgi:Ca2+-binding RTX toxin-like protein